METKICTSCGEEKDLSEYYFRKDTNKHFGKCKSCHYETGKLYRINNKEKQRERSRRLYARNPEKHRNYVRKYNKKYPDRVSECRRKSSAKLRNAIDGKLKSCLASAICNSLQGRKQGRHWEFLVGYTVEQLKQYLEKQFTDGMSWQNYGKWHIDHIRPKSSFQFLSPDDEDFKKCWSLSNLQPLWAKDNLQKHNKIVQAA